MTYLFSFIWLSLLLAAIIGFLLGWLVRDSSCRKAMRDLRSSLKDRLEQIREEDVPSLPAVASESTETDVQEAVIGSGREDWSDLPGAGDSPAKEESEGQSAFPIEAIQGIGQSIGGRLREQGIDTSLALLERCSADQGVRTVAEATGIGERALRGWTVVADLLRIPGMDAQLAQVLSNSGVESVQALGTTRAIQVWLQIPEKERNLAPETDLRRLEILVDEASGLRPMIQD